MAGAIYSPIRIPITGGTLTFRPADTGAEGKIRIEIVTKAGVQTQFIDASFLDLLQDQVRGLLAEIGNVAAG